MLSTRHQWFLCSPLLASHLTWFFPGLFLLRSRPRLLPAAASGGLEPAPASRFRGALPHRSSSYTLRGPFDPLCARGARSSAKRASVEAVRLVDKDVSIVDGRYRTVGVNGAIRDMWTTLVLKR